MSVQFRQLHIFGLKCLLPNNVVITIQFIPGSVVLVKLSVGKDLKFCSRLAHVCNTTDVKENKITQNKYSKGQKIYMLKTKTKQSKSILFRRHYNFILRIPSWCPDQKAACPA